jgi:hypothetical protein
MLSRFLSFVTLITLIANTAFSDPIPKYDRDLFGGWSDSDRDCQNMRHELLQDLSTAIVSFSQNTCRVTRGRWLDPYTNKIFLESRLLDIDHLVPLKYSWNRGALAWTSKKRRQFSNDPINLFAVERSVNRQKSAYGPAEWLPPNIKFRCQYIVRFQRVIKLYGLSQNATELQLINQAQQQYCK